MLGNFPYHYHVLGNSLNPSRMAPHLVFFGLVDMFWQVPYADWAYS